MTSAETLHILRPHHRASDPGLRQTDHFLAWGRQLAGLLQPSHRSSPGQTPQPSITVKIHAIMTRKVGRPLALASSGPRHAFGTRAAATVSGFEHGSIHTFTFKSALPHIGCASCEQEPLLGSFPTRSVTCCAENLEISGRQPGCHYTDCQAGAAQRSSSQ